MGRESKMNDIEKIFKSVFDWAQDVAGNVKPIVKETNINMNSKKIEVELPEKPSSGAYASCPSGDNEYNDAIEEWGKRVNAVVLNAIPRGYALKSSEVKEIKTVRQVAEIVVEKT